MLDDIAVVLASVGTASTAVALLRRRARRARIAALAPLRVGARHLADALSTAAAEPLPVAAHPWRSIVETLELEAHDTLQ